MRVYNFKSVNASYKELVRELMVKGEPVNPRGEATLELTPVSIVIEDPRRNLIFSPARRLNYGFALAEFLWVYSGSDSVEEIAAYNSNWRKFSDDGVTLNGAYGRRIRGYVGRSGEAVDQLRAVVDLLRADSSSRQATVTLFDPSLDYRETKDKPCTNLLRYKVRDGKLHALTFMRSNDVLLGYPYDAFNFTALQAVLAQALGVGLGTYTHVVDSFHLYKRDLVRAREITAEPTKADAYEGTPWPDNGGSEADLEGASRLAFKFQYEVDNSDEALTLVNKVNSEYWRSAAAFLALYNYRKLKCSQNTLNKFRPLITSEFKTVLPRYKSLV